MSQNVSQRVWKYSKVGGATLLLLLALADTADDWGYCYPSLNMLARRVRQDRKSVIQMLRKLERLGEIRCLTLEQINTDGRAFTGALYQVTCGLSEDRIRDGEKRSFLYRRIMGQATAKVVEN